MVILDKQKEELASYFKNVKGVLRTTGTADGVIIKFKDFYLKIYDSNEATYLVQGFKYNDNAPTFSDRVKVNEMREYALKFRTE